jgi:hypothetical protein
MTVFLLFLPACADFVPLEPSDMPQPSQQKPSYRTIQGPDPGSGLPLTTLHFTVEGYGATVQDKAQVVEKIFGEIVNQTALYSFKPQENYRVVIYQSKEEFQRKTGQPDWSGGMKTGRGVFTYEQDDVDSVLAHEITHIIFGEFMEAEESKHRWLNEGLAMYIDAHFEHNRRYDDIEGEWVARMRAEPPLMRLDDILSFKPYSEQDRAVRLWYSTSADFTAFLIKNGGAFNFSLFLKALKEGAPIDQALMQAYPGKYRTLAELYAVWRGTLGF